MLSKAIAIAAKAFEGRKDKGGKPYILHCLTVMQAVENLGEEAMIVAILHDIIEDCKEWNQEALSKEGFSYAVIHKIFILTKNKDEEYLAYIKRISGDKICTAIKLADLRHNSDITRLKGLTKKDFDRLEKYCTAYEYLKKV